MAIRNPSELARQAMTNGTALRIEFDLFRGDVKDLKLSELRERCALLESQLVALRKEVDTVPQLRQANAVLEDRMGKLEKRAEEADKRQWQFVYIFAGAMASLLVTVVVQLVLAWVKK